MVVLPHISIIGIGRPISDIVLRVGVRTRHVLDLVSVGQPLIPVDKKESGVFLEDPIELFRCATILVNNILAPGHLPAARNPSRRPHSSRSPCRPVSSLVRQLIPGMYWVSEPPPPSDSTLVPRESSRRKRPSGPRTQGPLRRCPTRHPNNGVYAFLLTGILARRSGRLAATWEAQLRRAGEAAEGVAGVNPPGLSHRILSLVFPLHVVRSSLGG
ncbi:hypothetical protein BDK51DRAFT_43499 [Blyttiomyces helicus]|uniref:Uncharacterized protein n=1 Tax=Blyttiomyces helicus TaxID=388810 RepID=A0A4P9WAR3_9FUNG|nr:hypothetical protein BDK51DRAFT_43499 [Blyttiomyces helicus]|eukprot:RKO87336.1 hypothetical protein BDK51DRAFT_43499 [Blyttiomyces helicus]